MQDIRVFKNDRTGVSPVIGVILMVAVTVIIAAVIGSTALGLGDSVSETPPQVSFETEQEEMDVYEEPDEQGPSKRFTALTITHVSGENVDKDDISVEVNGEPAYATLVPADDFYSVSNNDLTDPIVPWDSVDEDTISSGDSTTIVLGTEVIQNYGRTVGEDPINFEYTYHGSGTLVFVDNRGDGVQEDDGARLSEGDEVRIIWESGDQTQTLLEEEIQ